MTSKNTSLHSFTKVNSARVITRAGILTKLAKGHCNQEVCHALDVTPLPSHTAMKACASF